MLYYMHTQTKGHISSSTEHKNEEPIKSEKKDFGKRTLKITVMLRNTPDSCIHFLSLFSSILMNSYSE